MKTRHSAKWRQWIGCQGWFDPQGRLNLSLAKIVKVSAHQPYPYVVGETQRHLLVSFEPQSVAQFPKKYVVLPKV